ncbi:MAG: hypothetical protein H7Y88_02105 [Phycisphaerales bacterium]|nr:hypothetical protein [Phycisphaerales bacterium]
MSPRLLWTKTQDGTIPHVRLGRTVLYPVEQLHEWLRDQAAGGRR